MISFAKFAELFSGCCRSQPPARCTLYDVKKSIYRSLRSLAVVVLRSNPRESILQRDAKNQDVDIPRDRENGSEKENENKEEEEQVKEKNAKEQSTHYVSRYMRIYVYHKRY